MTARRTTSTSGASESGAESVQHARRAASGAGTSAHAASAYAPRASLYEPSPSFYQPSQHASPHSAAPQNQRASPPPPAQPGRPGRLERLGDGASSLVSWGRRRAGQVVDWGAERIDEAAQLGAGQLRRLAEEHVPEVLAVLEGPARFVQSVVEDGVAGWLEGRLDQVSIVDQVEPALSALGAGSASLTQFSDELFASQGRRLDSVFGPLTTVLNDWLNPLLERQIENLEQEQAEARNLQLSLFESGAEQLQPVVDAITGVATTVWNGVQHLVGRIPFGQEIWDWLRQRFDIAWSGASTVASYLRDFLTGAWERVQSAIEPVRPALETVGKILFLLSPMGPIYLLVEYGRPLWDQVTGWFADWDLSAILTSAREVFTEDVLPGLIDAAQNAADFLSGVADNVATLIDTVLETADFLEASPLGIYLEVLAVWVRWQARELRKFAELAEETLQALAETATEVLNRLANFLSIVLDAFVRLAIVAVNPFLLPVALAGGLWLLLPEGFKPAVIDFILNLLILATVAMPDALFGLAIFGPLIKEAFLGFLRGIKEGGAPASEDEAPSTTDRKVRAADKIAAIMMGGGVLFAAGLLAGLFAGLLDGIVGPILLVAMLIQFVVGALAMAVQFAHSTGQEIFGTGEGATADEIDDDEALAEEVTDYLASQGLEELVPPTADNLQELEAAFEETRGQDTAFDQAQSQATSASGIDLSRVLNFVASIADRIRQGAQTVGRTISEGIFRLIEKSDYDLGYGVGFITGMILFEVILSVLTGGGWLLVTAARPFIAAGRVLLSQGRRALGKILALLRRLKDPLRRGLSTAGDVLGSIPGLGPIIERVRRALRSLFRYGDDAARARPRRPGPTPPRATPDAPRTPIAPRRPPRDGGRPRRSPTPGQKQAVALQARAMAESFDRVNAPVNRALAALRSTFMPRYRWIRGFRKENRPGRGHWALVMLASRIPIDESYTENDRARFAGAFSADEFRALEQALGRRTVLRLEQRGVDPEHFRQLLQIDGVTLSTLPRNINDLVRWVDFRREVQVLRKWTNLRNPARADSQVALVRQILSHNTISAEDLGAVMDAAKRSGLSARTLVTHLDSLARVAPEGMNRLIGDLKKGGNFSRGAAFVLRYINKDNGTLLKRGLRLEVVSLADGRNRKHRRWDIVVGNVRYQLKSWKEFYPTTFVQQITEDLHHLARTRPQRLHRHLKWIFDESRGLDKTTIITSAREALLNPTDATKASALAKRFGLVDTEAASIANQLEKIIALY